MLSSLVRGLEAFAHFVVKLDARVGPWKLGAVNANALVAKIDLGRDDILMSTLNPARRKHHARSCSVRHAHDVRTGGWGFGIVRMAHATLHRHPTKSAASSPQSSKAARRHRVLLMASGLQPRVGCAEFQDVAHGSSFGPMRS